MIVPFSNKMGPWLLVTAADQESRWVHEKNDTDFEVELSHECGFVNAILGFGS
jgi:hypothetical protein